MVKKLILIFMLVFATSFIVSAANETSCTPNWKCAPWEDVPCVNGVKIRNCIDWNLCGTEEGKPDENKTCEDCTPLWDCTQWKPLNCPSDGRQERTCVDTNSCGKTIGKPVEFRSCTPQYNINWLFYLLVVVIFSLLIIDSIMIVNRWKKIERMENKEQIFKRSLPAKPSG